MIGAKPFLACIFVPELPVQVEQARRGTDTPFIIADAMTGETVFAASDVLLKLGIDIGMPLRQARQIAPSATYLPSNEDAYYEQHQQVFQALKTFTEAIETVGLGEFLMDVRGFERIFRWEELTQQILEITSGASQLKVRVGLGAGKFVAQNVARDAPDHGALIVPMGEERRWVANLGLSVLPGLPGEVWRRLTQLDLHSLGDLAALPKGAVTRQFGAEMAFYYELARGCDVRPLLPDIPPLRIPRAIHYREPATNRSQLTNGIAHLSRRIGKELNRRGYHAEGLKVTVEMGHSTPIILERGQPLKPPTADSETITRVALDCFGRLGVEAEVNRIAICAYPLRSWHLSGQQRSILEMDRDEKRDRISTALQLIIHRFGEAIIKVASVLGPPVPIPIDVRVNGRGLPAQIKIADRLHYVGAIQESWREERQLWTHPIRRDYFQVVLQDGSLRNIFQNLSNNEWFLDRAFPIL